MPVNQYIYAGDLVKLVKKVWRQTKLYLQEEEVPPLPSEKVLARLLDVAYHTSFLTEEGRRPSFRLVCCPRSEFKDGKSTRVKMAEKISFSAPCAFNEKQLLQLAPASDPTSVMIAVEPVDGEEGQVQIWGLLDTGSSWWTHMRRESERTVSSPPDLLTISSIKPGHIVISRAWRILLTLENGKLALPPVDVFLNGPLADDFKTPVEQIYSQVYADYQTADPYEPLLNKHNCSVKYITSIKRLLTYFMDKPHGGLLLIVPDDADELEAFEELVSVKYPCRHYELWSNLLGCLELKRKWFEVGVEIARGKEQCDRAKVIELSRLRSAVDEQEHQLTDRLQIVAALSGVDGAVVLTDRLRLIGFGAELKSKARVPVVYKAQDSLANLREPVVPETFGTRHRSAFRFCAEFGKGAVFVHSQDGGIKAVKRLESDIVYWDVNPPND